MTLHRGPRWRAAFFKDWGRGRPVVLYPRLDRSMPTCGGSSSGTVTRLVFAPSLRPPRFSAALTRLGRLRLRHPRRRPEIRARRPRCAGRGAGRVLNGRRRDRRYMSRHGGAGHSGRARLVGDALYAQDGRQPRRRRPAVFDGMIAGLKKDRPELHGDFCKDVLRGGMLHRRSRPTDRMDRHPRDARVAEGDDRLRDGLRRDRLPRRPWPRFACRPS